MSSYKNPFEFEQATQLSPEFVKDVDGYLLDSGDHKM